MHISRLYVFWKSDIFWKPQISLWHCFHVYYLFKISLWHGFRVPATTPWSMCLPAALRRPQKKHAPGILEHAFCEICGFCNFWVMLRSPSKNFIIWPIWSNDNASKTRIELLCKKTCSTAPHLFSKLDFFWNSWSDRTLAKMLTWRIEAGVQAGAESVGYIGVDDWRDTQGVWGWILSGI